MLKSLVSCISPVLMHLSKSKTPSEAASTPETKQMSARSHKKGQKIQYRYKTCFAICTYIWFETLAGNPGPQHIFMQTKIPKNA